MAKRNPRYRLANLQQIQNIVLRPTVEGIIGGLNAVIADQLHNNIVRTVYKANKPKAYNRDHNGNNFLDTITVEKKRVYSGRIAQGRVFIDPMKLSTAITPSNQWNRYRGYGSHTDFRQSLPSVLNDGTAQKFTKPGPTARQSLSGYDIPYYRHAANFMEETLKWVENNLGDYVMSIAMSYKKPQVGASTVSVPTDYQPVPIGIRIRRRV